MTRHQINAEKQKALMSRGLVFNIQWIKHTPSGAGGRLLHITTPHRGEARGVERSWGGWGFTTLRKMFHNERDHGFSRQDNSAQNVDKWAYYSLGRVHTCTFRRCLKLLFSVHKPKTVMCLHDYWSLSLVWFAFSRLYWYSSVGKKDSSWKKGVTPT